MISTLSTGIVLLFILSVVLSFFVPFLKDGVGKELTPPLPLSRWKDFAMFLLPLALLLVLGQLIPLEAANQLRFFAGAAVLPFLLSRINLPSKLSGIILLAASVFVSSCCPGVTEPGTTSAGAHIIAMLLGLLTFKTTENLFFKGNCVFDDVLPSLIWLSGGYWIQVTAAAKDIPNMQGLLLGTLSVVLLLRLMQGPFMFDDKIYLKRIMLSLSGGLSVLLVITKLLLIPDQAPIAALVGCGLFFAYCFELMGKKPEKSANPSQIVSLLVLTGMLTLIASRMFGTMGWLVLAPTVLIASRSNLAIYAGLFWVSRSLLQAFIYQFIPNVTGINLTHPYSSAALYAGMLAAAVASLMLRDIKTRWLSAALFLSLATLLPLGSNFFLHEEPTGSLLVSVTVAATLLAMLGQLLYREELPTHGTVALLPLQMTTVGLLGSGLIALGNTSSSSLRITVLACSGIVLCLLILVAAWLTRGKTAPSQTDQ